ncbi:hypothetical protein ANN_27347 [Periplaneta americana]|uniref:Uncharacterized protein n=1 Tax=Periplaneta americana TaxID=6978 RepID=A0ABQ8RXW6_PERAM|nr:hypothetical protein ANN_27347 [Periplaneta americana]
MLISSLDRTRIVSEATDHSHVPDWGPVQTTECMNSIKATASTSAETPAHIIQNHVSRVSSDAGLKLSKKESIQTKLREVRREHYHLDLVT